jgi:hypothetical protein
MMLARLKKSGDSYRLGLELDATIAVNNLFYV